MNYIYFICPVFDFSYVQVEFRTRLTNMCSAATTAVAMSIKNKDTRFAYSCKFHYDKNPLDIYTSIWRGPHGFLKETNRTCVLFTKDKVFHSFGYESKIKYTDLVKDEMHREWYFFERFLSFLDVQEVCMLSVECYKIWLT